jgi:hypothetical protein
VCLALNEACHIRSTKLRKFYGVPPESCREKLLDEGQILDDGCLRQTPFFQQVATILRGEPLLRRQRQFLLSLGSSLFAKHVKETVQSGIVATPYATCVRATLQKSLHYGFVQCIGLRVCPPEPFTEPGEQSNLVSNGCRRVSPFPDECGVGAEVPGPRAELRVERNERLFFHLARMVSRTAAGYAESLTSKLAQAGAIAGIFGIVRDSA